MLTMCILHSMNPICQEIFSCQLYTPREVVDLLILSHIRVKATFQRLCGPHQNPLITHRFGLVWQQLMLIDLLVFAEPIVFKCILYELYLQIAIKLVKEALV